MNRPSARLLAVLVPFLFLHTPAHAQAQFTARLSGAQEVPAVATAAQGTALVTLTSVGVQFFVTVEGLSGPITACHLHNAAAGVNGGVVRTLTGNLRGSTAMGEWTASDAEPLTPALIDELLKGNLYLNFHTAANPGGEIRGQVVPSAGVHFTAAINGNQENPPVAGGATGTGSFTLTEEALIYKITVNGLTGPITAAHLHTGAIGANGPVTITLTPSFAGTTATGTVVLTPTQRHDLIAGGLYVNIHTGANPGGEIRGQVQLAGGFGFSANLNSTSEVPINASTATATASATLTPSGLLMNLTATGLTGAITVAHIHNAAPGVNGGVVRTLTPDFVTATTALSLWRFNDTEPLTPALVSQLVKGNLYFNLHTAANPGGEIRGQLTLNQPAGAPGATFSATLTGTQEEPAVATAGLGTATFRLSPAGLAFNVTVDGLSGGITAAHFHNGAIGVNGLVKRTITADFAGGKTASGVWAPGDAEPLTPALITALMSGAMYLNVHTAANPGGEIRGQVLLASGAELEARLTAKQEIPTNASTALGTATLTLTREGLAFAVTVDGLSGAITAAHFHIAAPGLNGGVVRTITEFSGNTAIGVWKPGDAAPLTPALVTELLKGNLYFNIHTAANPGGEIRGQVRLSGGDGRGAVLLAGNEVLPVSAPGIGTASMTLTDQGVVFRTSANDLTGAITAAHFHSAAFGVNGPVVRPITADFAALTADGVWAPTDASPLTTTLIGELVESNIYLNLHTAANPGGEIRGQSGARTVASVEGPIASGVLQLANTPNPVRDRTSFSFYLPREADVTLKLFDVTGRTIATVLHGSRGAGWHYASFASNRLSAGVYLYRLNAGALSQTRKMLVIH